MRKTAMTRRLAWVVALALAACGSADPSANASSTLAPGTAATAAAPAAATAAAPQEDLFAFAAGAQFVAKPDDNEYADASYGPYNLIDESDSTDWRAQGGKPATLVLELAERTKLTRVSFDTAGLNIEEKAVKGVRVEVSDTSATDGFTQVLATELKKVAKGQSFPITATGRWVRITALSNYGAENYGLIGVHGYGEQLTHSATIAGLSGSYDGNSGLGNVRLKQEGTRVTGCYDYRAGLISGGTEGRMMKVELSEESSSGGRDKQIGLFSISSDGNYLFGLTRGIDDDASAALFSVYSANKVSGAIGDCPAIADWKGQAAKSQLSTALEKSGRARLDGINFDFNADVIRPESRPLLDQVAAMLKEHGDWNVTLEGHTDNVGGPAFNKDLSTRRAAAVKAYLATAGVPAARLASIGFGFDKPVASNDTQSGRAENRRVEIVKT
jgi:outer membrane protein OmpA-like peptidoglycan-associated protein